MIAIVGAMDVEIQNLLLKSNNIKKSTICGHDFYEAILNDKEVVITKLGIGKVNAAINATLLLSNFVVDLIINTGIAGGLLPLEINDVIISNKIYYYDVDIMFFGYQFGQVAGDPEFYQTTKELQDKVLNFDKNIKISNIASGDRFVSSIETIKEIMEVDNSVQVTDMEGGALAQVAHKFNTEFIIIRAISDIINNDNQLDKYDEETTSKVSQDILFKLLKEL